MENNTPRLLKLHTAIEYVAYQYKVNYTHKDFSAIQTLDFSIFTIMDWIRKKIGNDENLPEVFKGITAKEYEEGNTGEISSISYEGGFSVKTIYLPQDGTWAFVLKEPDMNAENQQRECVVGRVFITEIGIKTNNDKSVSLGCKVTVSDPPNATEIPYAYRPGFIRTLYSNENIKFFNTSTTPVLLDSAKKLNEAFNNLSDQPNIIFTPYINSVSQEVFENFLTGLKNETNIRRLMSLSNSNMEGTSKTTKNNKLGIPYDAEDFAGHSLGYANVYYVENKEYIESKIVKSIKSFEYGDIIIIEPKQFGGYIETIKYIDDELAKEKSLEKLLRTIHEYSKRKPFDFQAIRFYNKAFEIYRDNQIEELECSAKSANEKHDMMLDLLKQIKQENKELNEQNALLLNQLSEENQRASDEFKDQINELNKKIGEIESKLFVSNELNNKYQEILEKQNSNTIEINGFGGKELYLYEQYDLVASVLEFALKKYAEEDSRAYEILEKLVEKNPVNGEGLSIFEKVKAVL